MSTYTLSAETQNSISKQIGVPFDEIVTMDCEEIDAIIEKDTKRKLEFSYEKDDRQLGRGSMYIALRKLFSIKKINNKLKRI